MEQKVICNAGMSSQEAIPGVSLPVAQAAKHL
jgi:hypothetical protein